MKSRPGWATKSFLGLGVISSRSLKLLIREGDRKIRKPNQEINYYCVVASMSLFGSGADDVATFSVPLALNEGA